MFSLYGFFILTICCRISAHQVTVRQGVLEGAKIPLVTGDGSYFSFKGIPYAAAPIGELRFKHPYPPSNWTGVRSAKEHGSICLQQNLQQLGLVMGSEDCLFLNVYTPTLKPKKNRLPVMIWIHGGGFNIGSGDDSLFGPDFLVQHSVIVVTLNYRLGPLGFLGLDAAKVTGNAGLKDQVAAFEWVQSNIAQFGGDPNNVTIFGQSAGGACVSLHVLSPLSSGLFHRAIAMSGTALNEWAVPFESERRAFAIGRLLGFDTMDKNALITFLQKVNATDLVTARPYVLANEYMTEGTKTFFSTYSYEKYFKGKHFLCEDPLKILKKKNYKNVDFMIGHTKREALNIYFSYSDSPARYAEYTELFAPKRILNNVPPLTALKIADVLKTHYFGNEPVSNKSTEQFINYLSDTSFNYDIYKYISLLGDHSDHRKYLYHFSAVSPRNVFANANAKTLGVKPAAGHTDDVFYLFDPKQYNLTISKNSNEYKLVQQFTTLITNFAKYGNPTPSWIKNDKYLGTISWPKYYSSAKAYLEFDSSAITTERDLDSKAISLFDNAYKIAGIDY